MPLFRRVLLGLLLVLVVIGLFKSKGQFFPFLLMLIFSSVAVVLVQKFLKRRSTRDIRYEEALRRQQQKQKEMEKRRKQVHLRVIEGKKGAKKG